MIIWRTSSDCTDDRRTRFRAVYPAWCIWRAYETENAFAQGPACTRMLSLGVIGQSNIVVISRKMGSCDMRLAETARQAGWRVVYDHGEPLPEEGKIRRRQLQELRERIGPLVDAIVFPDRSTRDEFVANGLPAEKCRFAPSPVISVENEIAAVEWSEKLLHRFDYRRFVPGRKGWSGKLRKRRETDRKNRIPTLVWSADPGTRERKRIFARLAELVPDLNALAAKTPFELVLVTNENSATRRAMAGAEFPWRRTDWSLTNEAEAIRSATAAICPRDNFAGANGFGELASLRYLASGIPVIADMDKPCMANGAFIQVNSDIDWAAAAAPLLDPECIRTQHGTWTSALEQEYDTRRVAETWMTILQANGPAGKSPQFPGFYDRAGMSA